MVFSRTYILACTLRPQEVEAVDLANNELGPAGSKLEMD